jgi:hypothetical protein
MSSPRPPVSTESTPVDSLTDPRAISLLTTEHWSLLTARSLAYNEAFVRGGMFLTFMSMSFVGLALLSQAIGLAQGFLPIVAIVLAFDLVIGLTTYLRILGANSDDLRAVHGMARIRHGYTEIAPIVTHYFTTPRYDDLASVLAAYGSEGMPTVLYALSTSAGMIGLITSMVGGVLAAVIGMLLGAGPAAAVAIGLGGGVLFFLGLAISTFKAAGSEQARLEALFPSPDAQPGSDEHPDQAS